MTYIGESDRALIDRTLRAAMDPGSILVEDLDWFVREVVAYYKLYDHHEVWTEVGARALGVWLIARLAAAAVTANDVDMGEGAPSADCSFEGHDLDDGVCNRCGDVIDCGCAFRGHGFRHE